MQVLVRWEQQRTIVVNVPSCVPNIIICDNSSLSSGLGIHDDGCDDSSHQQQRNSPSTTLQTKDTVWRNVIRREICRILLLEWTAASAAAAASSSSLSLRDKSASTSTAVDKSVEVEKPLLSLNDIQVTHWALPFCNARFAPRLVAIRGGKGGFGTLLKGQSRQASAKTTTDFGACRDLQGRRLRHVNQAVHEQVVADWQQRIRAGTATPDELQRALTVATASGVANWHLAVPAWSEVSAKREVQRNQRLLSRHAREQRQRQQQRDDVQRRQEHQVAHYVNSVEQATQSVQASVAAAILAAQSRIKQPPSLSVATTTVTRTDHDDRNAAVTLDPGVPQPSLPPPTKRFKTTDQSSAENVTVADRSEPPPPPLALVTLSGDATLACSGDQEQEHTVWRLTGQSNFCTVGLLLDPIKVQTASQSVASGSSSSSSGGGGGGLYWEVVLVDNDETMTTSTTTTATSTDESSTLANDNDHSTDPTTALAVVQVGWAGMSCFRPDSDAGNGVGDVPYSWAYDTSRALALHGGSGTVDTDKDDDKLSPPERLYGTRPCRPGDVIGCCWDVYGTGGMSFAVNGKDLGVAFTVPMDAMRSESKEDPLICAAVSCNAGLSMDLKWHARDFQYSPVGPMVPVGNVMMDDENAVDWPSLLQDPERKGTRLDASREPSHAIPPESPVGTRTQKPVANDDHGAVQAPVDSHEAPVSNWHECESVEALTALGLDRLKSALQAAGLKCGGTLHERATRLWTVRGLSPSEYPTKLLAKK
jgi:Replication stress response SDE2 C-terminal/Silencing defective 2 N-terminal ubiquitin domain/SPRY domain